MLHDDVITDSEEVHNTVTKTTFKLQTTIPELILF